MPNLSTPLSAPHGPLFDSLHWLPVRDCIFFKRCLYVHISVNGHASHYITNLKPQTQISIGTNHLFSILHSSSCSFLLFYICISVLCCNIILELAQYINILIVMLCWRVIWVQNWVMHDSRVDKERNEPGRWKSRIVAIFLLFLTLLHVLTKKQADAMLASLSNLR